MNLFHIPEKKIRVIYEGASENFGVPVPENSITLMKQRFGITKPYLLYTGVWRDHKNVVGLLHAFKKIRESHEHLELVITGKPDPVYHEVLDTIHALGLEPYVHCVGLVSEEDLGSLYHGATLYVFPSFYEGFGIPPLEAFAAGLPVVCSNTSSLPEICGENNAYFFDPYSITNMADVISSLLKSPEQQSLLRQRGFQRLKDFSWERMAKETLDVYNTTLQPTT